eukprot:scaffold78800_cov100-Phaeocystis_antarctica.AAC.1
MDTVQRLCRKHNRYYTLPPTHTPTVINEHSVDLAPFASRRATYLYVWSVASARAAGARPGRRGRGRDAGAVVLVRLGSDQGRGGSQVSMGAAECGLMQWVRAACVRPAPCMRVCARSYLGRASIAKTVADILQQLQFKCLVCLSFGLCLGI